jgi:hypothetical protein
MKSERAVCFGLNVTLLVLLWAGICREVFSQTAFTNLDFESASLPGVQSNQTAYVLLSQALPGWQCYTATNPTSIGLFNALSNTGAEICLFGPYTPNYASNLISGYTVALQAGFYRFGLTSTAIQQNSLVPVTAKSILFDAINYSGNIGDFQVMLNGLNIPLSLIGSGPNYSTYGGDVSAFAGLPGSLRLTENPNSNPNATIFLDNIRFSDQQAPEPTIFGLLTLGVFILCGRILIWRSPKKG